MHVNDECLEGHLPLTDFSVNTHFLLYKVIMELLGAEGM